LSEQQIFLIGTVTGNNQIDQCCPDFSVRIQQTHESLIVRHARSRREAVTENGDTGPRALCCDTRTEAAQVDVLRHIEVVVMVSTGPARRHVPAKSGIVDEQPRLHVVTGPHSATAIARHRLSSDVISAYRLYLRADHSGLLSRLGLADVRMRAFWMTGFRSNKSTRLLMTRTPRVVDLAAGHQAVTDSREKENGPVPGRDLDDADLLNHPFSTQ